MRRRRIKDRIRAIEANPLTRTAAELRAAVEYLAGGPIPEDPRARLFTYEALSAGAEPNDCAEAVQVAHDQWQARHYLGLDDEDVHISEVAWPLFERLHDALADELRAAV